MPQNPCEPSFIVQTDAQIKELFLTFHSIDLHPIVCYIIAYMFQSRMVWLEDIPRFSVVNQKASRFGRWKI